MQRLWFAAVATILVACGGSMGTTSVPSVTTPLRSTVTPTPTPSPSPSPTPPGLPFSDSLQHDDGNWRVGDDPHGSYEYVPGGYEIRVNTATYVLPSAAGPPFVVFGSSMSVSVDETVTAAGTDYDSVHVICVYHLGHSDEMKFAGGVDLAGEYGISYRVNENTTQLLGLGRASPVIHKGVGAKNHITFTCDARGGTATLTLTVNGTRLGGVSQSYSASLDPLRISPGFEVAAHPDEKSGKLAVTFSNFTVDKVNS